MTSIRAARYTFANNDAEDPRLTESRALACELVAFHLVLTFSEKELIDQLLYELPIKEDDRDKGSGALMIPNVFDHNETSPLLDRDEHDFQPSPLRGPPQAISNSNLSSSSLFAHEEDNDGDDISEAMAGMNALEIAAVAESKKFLSQKPVQAVVEDIWNGNIIFWDSLSIRAKKSPKIYNKATADPFSRLRVPKYQKAFQVAFFVAFLVLYYAVLIERSPRSVTATEILLYVWIAAFAYDEFGELRDAGFLFYQSDFWSVWDFAIITTGFAFLITRVVGLAKDSNYITDVAFDILSIAALFLIPRCDGSVAAQTDTMLTLSRICAVASLNPYFGSLLPVLKEMVCPKIGWNEVLEDPANIGC